MVSSVASSTLLLASSDMKILLRHVRQNLAEHAPESEADARRPEQLSAPSHLTVTSTRHEDAPMRLHMIAFGPVVPRLTSAGADARIRPPLLALPHSRSSPSTLPRRAPAPRRPWTQGRDAHNQVFAR